MKPPSLHTEAARLEALRKYQILDTLPEQAFDDLTFLTAQVCAAPVALIGFIDAEREWLKSKIGIDVSEFPRYKSFCTYVIQQPDLLVVADTLRDERFATSPLVTSKPYVRFYAGAPLVTPDGYALGALCVIDYVPRELDDRTTEALRALSRQVMWQLELRRQAFDLSEINNQLRRSEAKNQTLIAAVPDPIFHFGRNGTFLDFKPAKGYEPQLSPEQFLGRKISEVMPPELSELAMNAIEQALRSRDVQVLEYQLAQNGEVRSFEARFVAGDQDEVLAIARDITERQQVVERLHESEDRYRDLVENSQDLICTHDLEGRLLSVNPWAAKVIGYDQSSLLKKNIRDGLLPEFRHLFDEYLTRIQRDGRARGLMMVQTRTGEKRIWEYNNTLRTQGVAAPIVRGMAHDITERKQAQQMLQKTVSLLTSTLESTADGILVVELGRKIVAFNEKFLELWRIPEEVIELRDDEVTLEFVQDQLIDPEAFMKRVKQLYAQPATTSYDIVEFKDGRIYERYCQPQTLDGKPVGRVWSFRDITERKTAEAQLRDSEQHFRALIENALDIIMVLSADGIIRYESPAIRRFRGYAPEELIGRQIRDFVHPDDLPAIEKGFAFKLANPGVPHSIECRMLHKDGTYRFIEGTSVNLLGDPAVNGIVANTRDVTDRKQTEQALRESEEKLRQLQKMEAVGRLAGGIAHDFNNLLTAIIGYSDLSLRRLEPADPMRRNIEEIKRAGERAATLTRQLLAFSRKQILQPKALNLNNVIREMDGMLQRLIGERIELTTELEPTVGHVLADPSQIEQVLMNLTVNACDAMPEGGRLVIKTANIDLDSRCGEEHKETQPGRYVLLAVSDTGHGMNADTQAHIFEPFFTTKGQGKGTGLGLSTVYGIVNQSDGHICVHSEPRRGATFEVYLPRVDTTVEETELSAARVGALQGRETVLLVEDESVVRSMTREVLEGSGYRVIEATDGTEAFTICRLHAGPIHLMLTDVIMPGVSVRELAGSLRQLRPDMRVLYMSGYTDDAIVHHGVLDEGVEFIEKPFTPDALTRKVRQVLETRPGGPSHPSSRGQ